MSHPQPPSQPPSPGDAAKPKMDADSHGGVRHWVVGTKSTPAQEAETKMMKFHLLPNHTPPPAVASNLFHLPFPPTLIHSPTPHPHSPHLLPPRISCFTRSPPFPPCPVTDIQPPLLTSPLYQRNFLAFSHHPQLPPLFSSHLLLAQSPENGKGGQRCHNIGSHFFPTASGLSGSRIDVSGFPPQPECSRADQNTI